MPSDSEIVSTDPSNVGVTDAATAQSESVTAIEPEPTERLTMAQVWSAWKDYREREVAAKAEAQKARAAVG